jgi:N-hydroxyarylamine O-acetyltransferase
MDTAAYLNRIGFKGEVNNDYLCLKQLQFCHLFSIPYENIDIVSDKPIKLDVDSLFEKIIVKRRGGYCFELNGLFGALLSALGFNVTDCMARFLKGETEIPMRRHRVLKVKCPDGSFLCDVGVGIACPIYPVRLDTEEIQHIGNEQYKITYDNFLGTIINQCYKGVWDRFFSFTDEPQLDIDYIMPSFYCEKHPNSIFNKSDMLAILNEYGEKHSISGSQLTYWDKDGKHKATIEDDNMRKAVLLKYFGIDLD